LALSSFQFQEEFTHWRAMTEGGKEVPVEVNQVPDDVVALRGGRFALKQGFDPRLEYFIGTSKEFDQFDFDKWVQANQ